MRDLVRLIVWMVVDLIQRRAALEAEIWMLRQQINVLRRAAPLAILHLSSHKSSSQQSVRERPPAELGDVEKMTQRRPKEQIPPASTGETSIEEAINREIAFCNRTGNMLALWAVFALCVQESINVNRRGVPTPIGEPSY